MRRRIAELAIGAMAASMLVGVLPAAAAPSRTWPVTPGTLGSLYGTVDPGGMTSLRIWGAAAWCYVQPTPDADIAANLDRLVAGRLDAVARAGGTAVMTIGHPAPWVFDNHPSAVRRTATWSCGDHAAGRAIPSYKSLRPKRDGSPTLQARRFRDYVGSVVDYLAAHYHGGLKVVLETWNEPNIRAGLDPKLRIPGSARTSKDAAKALHALDTIAYDVIRAKGARGWLRLGSSPLILRANTFVKTYLKAHNRKRRVNEIHLNVYSYRTKSVNRAVAKWDSRAKKARKLVRKYRKLRTLPMALSEVNLNLINHDSGLNLRSSFTNAEAQRRMATATQMNAYYHGFSAVYWLAPWRQMQTAVYVRTEPGNPARDALATLQSTLLGKRLIKCTQKKKVRTCTFRGPGRAKTLVMWRSSGSSRVRATKSGELVEMTGATRSVTKRQRLRIGTTPVVLR
jgi:hypothetical protein